MENDSPLQSSPVSHERSPSTPLSKVPELPKDIKKYVLTDAPVAKPAEPQRYSLTDAPVTKPAPKPALKISPKPSPVAAPAPESPVPAHADGYSSAGSAAGVPVLRGLPHHQQHPQHGGPFSAGGLTAGGPLDPAAAFGGMGQGLSAEAHLEQLAANVRSSTTTTASDRAKQVFVQAWLSANYAPYPDGNVPRQGLYNSYRRVCDQYNIPHINTATLGKAIRLCFPNIKTRRLGVRGNSKYHYCGIRPATVAEAEFLQDFVRRTTNHAAIAASSRRGAAAVAAAQAAAGNGSDEEDDEDSEVSSSGGAFADSKDSSQCPASFTLGGGLKSPTLYSMLGDDKTPTTNTLLSAAQAASLNGRTPNNNGGLGSGDSQVSASNAAPGSRPGTSSGFNGGSASAVSVKSLPNFPSINEALGIDSKPPATAAIEAWRWFEDHLDGLLESVRGFRFDQFEIHVRTFWASLSGDYREVVHAPAVAGLVVRADAVVYDEILEILRTQMLATIPPHALASLRQLAEKMEKILLLALEGYGNTFVEPKVELGARFGHLVLRFLDMYQVTQALTSVLSDSQQVANMRRAWYEVDFESVRNQSALVCNCRHEDLQQLLEVDFVAVLDGLAANAQLGGIPGSTEPVRDVMNWADMCCERLMGRAGGDGEEKSTMSSRSVLIRWGYVTSQVMRDLTIRSDPAFGAFQILKLFLDDWIALNVLRSVALSTNSVQASVEPVMQPQYLALSPMPGQEFTGTATSTGNAVLPTHAHHSSLTAQLMDHTPTTTSMLAALQDFNGTQQGTSSTQGAHHHPLANSTTFDNTFAYGSVESGSFSEYSGSFDMFLTGGHDAVETAHSPAAQSVGSSASVADLTAGVAATGVGGSEAGESPVPGRRGSDESVDVKHENL
ncbi:hypothetical protein M407DRAFT_70388 [Tulasnella calospora MUT 4182]|uniref:RFX-type winged-helix domain-containing protein n=1 Tax=Tulasnella calospora MUT 4182 TaxID=1051891 RepID=A0A0C3L6P2_9AGAM|nr:hypothetical protein M407DRAFT_70388 [Tulasnella calospora MUT 4182]